MRASEKLKTLDGRDWPHPLPPLFDALPQIVAVVDEAERIPDAWPKLDAALAALDEALKC